MEKESTNLQEYQLKNNVAFQTEFFLVYNLRYCSLRSQKRSQNSFQIACGNGILACMSRDSGV